MVSGTEMLMPEPAVASGVATSCSTVIDSGATMYASAECKNGKETNMMATTFMTDGSTEDLISNLRRWI
jgi:hypothetical protein